MTNSVVAAARQAAQRAHNTNALCLTSDDQSSALLRRELARLGNSKLPTVLSLKRLATTACLYPQHKPAQVINAARLLLSPPDRALYWSWQIYAALPDPLKGAYGIRLAEELAHIMDELAQRDLQTNANNMPYESADFSDESAVIGKLRKILSPPLVKEAQALEKLTLTSPLLLFSQHQKPAALEAHFLRQWQKCEEFRPLVGKKEEALRAALSANADDDTAALGDYECLVGIGETLGHTAKLALAALQHFAAAGSSVGIVVYDRLLARRLRAEAENIGILISDTVGWRASTLSYGASLRCFCALAKQALEAASAEVLLQAPWWASKGEKFQSELAFDWRKTLSTASCLPEQWKDLTTAATAELQTAAQCLATASDNSPKQATPAEWLRWLFQQSETALSAHAEDPIAEKLRNISKNISDIDESLSGSEFCDWLDAFLDGEICATDTVKSSVVFISPAQNTKLFDSLLLLGINADTLPSVSQTMLSEGTRKSLGLALHEEKIEEERLSFCRLLAGHQKIAAVRQSSGSNGEKKEPSPFWELLNNAIQRSGGSVQELTIATDNRQAGGLSPPRPATVNTPRLPEKLNITSGGNLMQCPYWFFIHDILALDDTDGTEEASPLFLGSLLHTALDKFIHRAGDEKDATALRQHWQAALATVMQNAERPGLALTHWHWLAKSENFIQWEAKRRQDGWHTVASEKSLRATLNLAGEKVILSGRIDRVDKKQNELAIIDYKTTVVITKEQLTTGEKPQMPLYAIMENAQQAELILCQPIGKGRLTTQLTADETLRYSRRVASRLRTVLRQIISGTPLPANGATDDCKKCSARRVCRREHWA